MMKMKCRACGSYDIVKGDNSFICSNCGKEYLPEQIVELLTDDSEVIEMEHVQDEHEATVVYQTEQEVNDVSETTEEDAEYQAEQESSDTADTQEAVASTGMETMPDDVVEEYLNDKSRKKKKALPFIIVGIVIIVLAIGALVADYFLHVIGLFGPRIARIEAHDNQFYSHEVGCTIDLFVDVNPKSAEEVVKNKIKWTSSNKNVATINEKEQEVVLVGEGDCIITARYGLLKSDYTLHVDDHRSELNGIVGVWTSTYIKTSTFETSIDSDPLILTINSDWTAKLDMPGNDSGLFDYMTVEFYETSTNKSGETTHSFLIKVLGINNLYVVHVPSDPSYLYVEVITNENGAQYLFER